MAGFKFELGSLLKERVTSFTGVVMCRSEYLTGCNHYALQSPNLKEGIPIDWEHFDETRLELVKTREQVEAVERDKEEPPSGPFPIPPQR